MADRRTSFDRWTVLVLLAVAVFQFWAAGHFTVFDDEAFSCQRYVMPMGEMIAALREGVEPDPPLYYVLQNAWVHVVGVGPLGLRGLSIVFFLTGLVVIRVATQAWYDRTTGLVAMLLCAIHPAHLFFGFAARWYSLMFLCVAVLFLATARMTADNRRAGGRSFLWALAAAATCYTNYFGPVVVLFFWMAGFVRGLDNRVSRQRWLLCAVWAIVAYLFWLGPYWDQVTGFARPEASLVGYASIAAKTSLALLTGNLASPRAWWAWGPMVLFGVGLLVLLMRQVWFAGSLMVVVFGCFGAGVLSRTMMDKYVMAFSGIACVLAAALLAHGLRPVARRRTRKIAEWTLVALVVGCLGCGVNLLTERHWSSLRWLDPFESVVAEILDDASSVAADSTGRGMLVVSHPSARYYAACHEVAQGAEGHPLSADAWRIAFMAQASVSQPQQQPQLQPQLQEREQDTRKTVTPMVALSRLAGKQPPLRWVTLETTGFRLLPDWDLLKVALDRDFDLVRERQLCEDFDAAWKDRVDPHVRHPRRRIIVRQWARKNIEPSG